MVTFPSLRFGPDGRINPRIGAERQRVIVAGELKMLPGLCEVGLRKKTPGPLELEVGLLVVESCRLGKATFGGGPLPLCGGLLAVGANRLEFRALGRGKRASWQRGEGWTVPQVDTDCVQQNRGA